MKCALVDISPLRQNNTPGVQLDPLTIMPGATQPSPTPSPWASPRCQDPQAGAGGGEDPAGLGEEDGGRTQGEGGEEEVSAVSLETDFLIIVSLVQEDEDEGEEDEGYSSVNRHQSRRARWESL